MNTKLLIAMLFVFLIVAASGCVQTGDGEGSSTGPDQAYEQDIVDSLGYEIVDETETIDIGELI